MGVNEVMLSVLSPLCLVLSSGLCSPHPHPHPSYWLAQRPLLLSQWPQCVTDKCRRPSPSSALSEPDWMSLSSSWHQAEVGFCGVNLLHLILVSGHPPDQPKLPPGPAVRGADTEEPLLHLSRHFPWPMSTDS